MNPLQAAAPEDAARRYVHPGEVQVSRESISYSTVLGSCVAVCLFVEGEGGGMNHYLLPQAASGAVQLRYGEPATLELLRRMRALDLDGDRLRAKVFGGASPTGIGGKLGESNVALAMKLLREAGVPVVGQDVGGAAGRHLIFDPVSGAAWVRRI
jgi:chemotaxis protein CheD